MADKVDIFMPLYVADYLADTMDLTAEENGAYMFLLMASWKSDGALPNDPRRLSRIARIPFDRWPDMWAAIGRFFTVTPASVSQGRLMEELGKARDRKSAAAENGAKGAAARWRNHGVATGSPVADGMAENGSSPSGSLSSGSPHSGSSLPPDPERAIPGATGTSEAPVVWSANDWFERFSPAWSDSHARMPYGRGAGDGRAIATLQGVLNALPREDRIAVQLRAALIFAEFFGDRSPKAIAEKYQFSYFVLRFNGLRAPAKEATARAGPGPRAPSTATRDAFANLLSQGKP